MFFLGCRVYQSHLDALTVCCFSSLQGTVEVADTGMVAVAVAVVLVLVVEGTEEGAATAVEAVGAMTEDTEGTTEGTAGAAGAVGVEEVGVGAPPVVRGALVVAAGAGAGAGAPAAAVEVPAGMLD
jgi:hypothetical protein